MLVRTELYRKWLPTQSHLTPPPLPLLLCWIGPVPTLFPLSPDIVSLFMASSRHTKKGTCHVPVCARVLSHDTVAGMLYKCLAPWLGDGLLLSSGDKWSMRRKQLTPAFHHSATLHDSIPVFQRRADELRLLLLQHADADAPPCNKCASWCACGTPRAVSWGLGATRWCKADGGWRSRGCAATWAAPPSSLWCGAA